jgi:acetyl esterase/lipase
MSLSDKLAVAWCVALLLLGLAALPPARSALAWYIRVGVPEVGWVFLLASLPALAWLLRTTPRLALVLAGLLVVAYGWPWVLAWRIRGELPTRVAQALPGQPPPRDPLRLGEVAPVTVSTEEYRPGLSWDRYRPADGPVSTRVLFLHGGSWARGTRDEYMALVQYLAGRGHEVISASYRLAPNHPFPAAVEDVEAAIGRLAAEGPEPLVVMGRSAGGHLGLLAAYRDPARVAGVIDIYAPVDMHFSWENPSHPKVLDSFQVLGDFLGGSPEETGATYDRASPVQALGVEGPPTLVIHGTRDSMVFPRQAGILEERLVALGVPHFVLRLPWLEHGGDVFLRGPTGRLLAWTVEAFLGGVSGG